MQHLESHECKSVHYIGDARAYTGLRNPDEWGGFYLVNKARTGRTRSLQASDCPLCTMALNPDDTRTIAKLRIDDQDYLVTENSNPIVAGHLMIFPVPVEGPLKYLQHRLDLNSADARLMISLARDGFQKVNYQALDGRRPNPALPNPADPGGRFSRPWATYVNPVPGSGRSEPHLHINCVLADYVPLPPRRTAPWQICRTQSGTAVSRLSEVLFYALAVDNVSDQQLAGTVAELHTAMNEWQQAYNIFCCPTPAGGVRTVVVPRDREYCDAVDQKVAGLEFLTGVLIPGPSRVAFMDTVLRDRAMLQATLNPEQRLRLERLLRGRFELPSAGSAVFAVPGSDYPYRPMVQPNRVFETVAKAATASAGFTSSAEALPRSGFAWNATGSMPPPAKVNGQWGKIDSSLWYLPAEFDGDHDYHTKRVSANVLVRITRASICQSDRRVLANRKMNSVSGLVLGHEAGGYVVDPGPWSDYLNSGDKVVVLPHLSCGECDPCHGYRSNLCRNMVHLGFHLHGNLAELMAFPYQCIVPVEPAFPSDALPLVEPLSCVLRALSRIRAPLRQLADIDRGGSPPLFTVFGAGPMGCLAALAVQRLFRGTHVRMVDPNPIRRRIAMEREIAEEVLEHMPASEESAISFVASSNLKATLDGIETTEYGGTVVLFSGINVDEQLGESSEYQGKNLEHIHRREQSILQEDAFDFKRTRLVGSSGYILDDVKRSIAELRAYYFTHYRRVQNIQICGLKSRTLAYTPPNIGELELPCDSVEALISPRGVDDELIANTLKVLITLKEDDD